MGHSTTPRKRPWGKSLPDSMKINPPADGEQVGLMGAYLMYRERQNRTKTKQNVILVHSSNSMPNNDLVRQSVEEAKNMVQLGSRYEAGLDVRQYEKDHPEVKDAATAAFAYLLS